MDPIPELVNFTCIMCYLVLQCPLNDNSNLHHHLVRHNSLTDQTLKPFYDSRERLKQLVGKGKEGKLNKF